METNMAHGYDYGKNRGLDTGVAGFRRYSRRNGERNPDFYEQVNIYRSFMISVISKLSCI